MEYAHIDWIADAPSAADYGDIYFNPDDGAAESAHVFLHGNSLEARFARWSEPWFCIGETGFGTGLNFLQTWRLWEQQAEPWQQLHFVSFEKHPLHPGDIRRSLGRWTELIPNRDRLLHVYSHLVPGWNRFDLGRVHLTLFIGDASAGLADCDARVHAWFLDGFAPGCNPELWQPALFRQIAALSQPDTTLATFTVARAVRDGLLAAGFAPERVPGYGRKRHNLRARFTGFCGPRLPERPARAARWPRPDPQAGRVGIIGGGLAAAELAPRLRARRLDVTVITPDGPGSGASGNRHGAVYVNPGLEADPPTAFYAAALSYRCRHWSADWPGNQCGVLQLLSDERAERFSGLSASHPFHGLTRCVSAEQTDEIAGIPVGRPALWMPHSGWLAPSEYCRQALAEIPCWRAEISAITRDGNEWCVTAMDGSSQRFSQLIIAAGARSNQLLPEPGIPLQAIRGQVSSRRCATPLKSVLCGAHYATPIDTDGWWSYGATFHIGDNNDDARPEDDEANLRALEALAPELAEQASRAADIDRASRAGIRVNTPDYLPACGPAPLADEHLEAGGMRLGVTTDQPAERWYQPGLFVLTGLGAKGLATAPLLAEHLVSRITGEPSPIGVAMASRIQPGRFAFRRIRRSG